MADDSEQRQSLAGTDFAAEGVGSDLRDFAVHIGKVLQNNASKMVRAFQCYIVAHFHIEVRFSFDGAAAAGAAAAVGAAAVAEVVCITAAAALEFDSAC